jgi:hypothetical protein
MNDNSKSLNSGKHLLVTIETIKVQRKSNYFAMVELEDNSNTAASKNIRRTDVAIATAKPRFRRNSFEFCLCLSILEQGRVSLAAICKLFEIVLHKDSSETNLIAFARVSLSSEHLDRLLSGETVQERNIQLISIDIHHNGRKSTSECKWFRRKSIVPSTCSFGTLSLSFQLVCQPKTPVDSEFRFFGKCLPYDIPQSLRDLAIGSLAEPPQYIKQLMNMKYDFWMHSMFYGFPGHETHKKFVIRCLGVVNLPPRCNPFFSVKTTADVADDRPSRSVTNTVPHTRNAIIYDSLVVEEEQSNSGNRGKSGLFAALVDHKTKKYLAKVILPCEQMIPGEQYNVAVVFNDKGGCLLLSITLESPLSFQTHLLANFPQLNRFEVTLHSIGQRNSEVENLPKDPFCSCPVVACLHIVDDLDAYLDSLNQDSPKLPFKWVFLADPESLNDLLPSCHKISLPSLPFVYPYWNTSFEFYKDANNLLSTSALVVEFFRMDFPKHQSAHVIFCGYAAVPLQLIHNQPLKYGDTVHYRAPVHLLTLPLSLSFDSYDKTPRKQSSVVHMTNKDPIPEVVKIPCQPLSETEYLIDATAIPNSPPLYVDLEIRSWSSHAYLTHIQKIQRETESIKEFFSQSSVKTADNCSQKFAVTNTDSKIRKTLSKSKSQVFYRNNENPHVRPLTPLPSEIQRTEQASAVSNIPLSKLAQSSPANIIHANHSGRENPSRPQPSENKELNSQSNVGLSYASMSSRRRNRFCRQSLGSFELPPRSTDTLAAIAPSRRQSNPTVFHKTTSFDFENVVVGQKEKQKLSEGHPPMTQTEPTHVKRKSEGSSTASTFASKEGEDDRFNSYSTSSSESDTTESAPLSHSQGRGRFNINYFIDGFVPPSPLEENIPNPFATVSANRPNERVSSCPWSAPQAVGRCTSPLSHLHPETEGEVIITLALARIQEMLNAALVQKQKLIDRLRKELFQKCVVVDTLNEEKVACALQIQNLKFELERTKRMFQEREVGDVTFPNATQLESVDKHEILNKYELLRCKLFQLQSDLKASCPENLEEFRKKLEEEIEQLIKNRNTLVAEIRELQEKASEFDTKAYNYQLCNSILERLNLVTAALQSRATNANNFSIATQDTSAHETDKDKQIASLMRRIQELEEENHMIKMKLRGYCQSFSEALGHLQDFLSK